MVNAFKLAVVHFALLNPMQTSACAWIYRWIKETVQNQERAARPSWAVGHWVIMGLAAGPSGRQAVATRWTAGLFLAKPVKLKHRS